MRIIMNRMALAACAGILALATLSPSSPAQTGSVDNGYFEVSGKVVAVEDTDNDNVNDRFKVDTTPDDPNDTNFVWIEGQGSGGGIIKVGVSVKAKVKENGDETDDTVDLYEWISVGSRR